MDAWTLILRVLAAAGLSAVIGLTWRVTPLIVFDVEAQLFNNDRVTAGITLTF